MQHPALYIFLLIAPASAESKGGLGLPSINIELSGLSIEGWGINDVAHAFHLDGMSSEEQEKVHESGILDLVQQCAAEGVCCYYCYYGDDAPWDDSDDAPDCGTLDHPNRGFENAEIARYYAYQDYWSCSCAGKALSAKHQEKNTYDDLLTIYNVIMPDHHPEYQCDHDDGKACWEDQLRELSDSARVYCPGDVIDIAAARKEINFVEARAEVVPLPVHALEWYVTIPMGVTIASAMGWAIAMRRRRTSRADALSVPEDATTTSESEAA